MKAIKLASIFAVSAVAAAVSTTTIAAEPVFSGSAGIYFTSMDVASSDTATTDDQYLSDGEVNVIGDTGVVYFDLDMSSDQLVLDEAYVTQGAVQFGDFDGALVEDAAVYGGVEEGNDLSTGLGADLGIRYSVSDELTVAFEATEDSDNDGFAVKYENDFGVANVILAAGTQGDDGSTVAAGVEIPLGVATLAGYYQTGTTTGDADLGNYGVGIDLALTDAFSVSAAVLGDTESEGSDDASNVEISAFYTVGDVEYVATYVNFDEDVYTDSDGDNYYDYFIIGARASF